MEEFVSCRKVGAQTGGTFNPGIAGSMKSERSKEENIKEAEAIPDIGGSRREEDVNPQTSGYEVYQRLLSPHARDYHIEPAYGERIPRTPILGVAIGSAIKGQGHRPSQS